MSSKKVRLTMGDGLLCVALACAIHQDARKVREAAQRVAGRVHKANRLPFRLMASSPTPDVVLVSTLDQLCPNI